MLSNSLQFLFVHIPKTGGNSIQDLLRHHSDDDFVRPGPHHDGIDRFELASKDYQTKKHSTLTDYLNEYGHEMFGRLYRFTCVRNPWDRVVSFYFSPHRGSQDWARDSFLEFIPTVPPVRHYLSLPGDARPSLEEALKNVHSILRFEQLQTDFDSLAASLGIVSRVLPKRNSSSHANYQTYYDEETKHLVAQRFREEIECLDYRFGL